MSPCSGQSIVSKSAAVSVQHVVRSRVVAGQLDVAGLLGSILGLAEHARKAFPREAKINISNRAAAAHPLRGNPLDPPWPPPAWPLPVPAPAPVTSH